VINHARTLLLGQEGEIIPTGYYVGEEYVPEYSPVVLTLGLKPVYDALFGLDPDYEGRLYRTAQYMALLDSTEYSEYVSNFDSRLTYDVGSSGFTGLDYGIEITTDSVLELAIVGVWEEPSYKGRMRNDWVVEATGSNQILVRHVQTKTTQGTVLTFSTSGVSNQFKLPESDLKAIIIAPSGMTGDRWDILHRTSLAGTLADVMTSLEALSFSARQALFGVRQEEPWLTFRNLFDKNQLLPFRFSGALLAFIYRIEAQRNP